MPPPSITLYVDTVSPFAYIAYHVLRNDPAFRTCRVTYIPILLGGLMKQCNNTPPLAVKNKDKWIDKERRTWSALLDVPMHESAPPNFPPRTLPVMRALTAIQLGDDTQQTQLTAALDALYNEFFVRHTDLLDQAQLKRILGAAGQKDVESLLARASSDAAVKGRLAANTDEAFARGAFGLPWMACTDEKGRTEEFWGVDRLAMVADFLGLERPGGGALRAML